MILQKENSVLIPASAIVDPLFEDGATRSCDHYSEARPLQNIPFWPISASGSNFNPRNIQHIPVVEIIAILDLDQN